jgi:hypothetical protein
MMTYSGFDLFYHFEVQKDIFSLVDMQKHVVYQAKSERHSGQPGLWVSCPPM